MPMIAPRAPDFLSMATGIVRLLEQSADEQSARVWSGATATECAHEKRPRVDSTIVSVWY